MTTQPQNNDLRRKADEKIAQKESKLFKDYVDKDFGFGNYIFISLDDAIDAMLEFHQEQGQRDAEQVEKLKEALLRIANRTESDDVFESDREIAAQALNSLKENK